MCFDLNIFHSQEKQSARGGGEGGGRENERERTRESEREREREMEREEGNTATISSPNAEILSMLCQTILLFSGLGATEIESLLKEFLHCLTNLLMHKLLCYESVCFFMNLLQNYTSMQNNGSQNNGVK